MMHRRSRAVIAAALAGAMTFASHGLAAAFEPMTVIVPPTPPQKLQPSAPWDPNAIPGIRIEENGALVTGPLDSRRVYIPLDKPIVPKPLVGLWVGKRGLCASAPAEAEGMLPPDGVLRITGTEMLGRVRMTVVNTFVPLPSSFTLEMLQSGRRLVLPSHRYRDVQKVLVIHTLPDGRRDYAEIGVTPDARVLELHGRNGRETAFRCGK